MTKRVLGSLCVVGAILAAGAGMAPSTHVHAAGSTRTVHQEGFLITFPTTWHYATAIKLSDIFQTPKLQSLPGDASGAQSTDGKAEMLILVVRGTASAAALKTEETAMYNDGPNKPATPIKYSTVKQHGATFTLAASTVKIKSQVNNTLIAAVAHAGKTYYFLAQGPADSSAQSKADLAELTALLNSIAVS